MAGGHGTRLNPITLGISKQLLPVYDKPMIYYPLSVLMLAGIQEILLISTEIDIGNYKRLLGDGSQFGLSINYAIQKNPNGLGEAFIIGENFIGDSNVCLILGDNIFYGQFFSEILENACKNEDGAVIFGYKVKDPRSFGIVEFNETGMAISLEEKPLSPKSNYAIPGLYFYSNEVIEMAKSLKTSARGEYEITDINKKYLVKNKLKVNILGRGFAWLDTGTCNSLLDAGQFVQTIENRTQGLKVACLEEIAFNKSWISKKTLRKQANKFKQNGYGKYLKKILEEND